MPDEPIPLPVLEPQFKSREQQREASVLGMWIFLATEVLIFGGILTAFFAMRVFYPEDFARDAGKLNLLIGGINTLVLITSCLFMALSVHAAEKGRRGNMLAFLSLTALLGLAFLGIKGYEYYVDWRDGIVPTTSRYDPGGLNAGRLSMYMIFYFVLTGLHAVHLAIAIALIVCLMVLTALGKQPRAGATVTMTVGMFWDFVDIMWMFLFAILYLSGHRDGSELHF